MASFEICFTTLHRVGTPAEKLLYLSQFKDAEVKIPRSKNRSAKVTVPINDTVLGTLSTTFGMADNWAYSFAGHFKYRDYPVFWGQCNQIDFDFPNHAITFNFRDPSLRMESHFLQRADTALNDPHNIDKGLLPIDTSEGLKLLRDAANNLAGQDSRGVPVLGIKNGSSSRSQADGSAVAFLPVERGQQVWAAWTDLCNDSRGPDFDLKALDIDDTPGLYYCQLDQYDFMGTGFGVVEFDFGYGNRQLTGLTWSPQGPLYTHVHEVTQDKKRRTRYNADTSEQYGIFVDWEQEDFKSRKNWKNDLDARGDAVLNAYGRPLNVVTGEIRSDGVIGEILPSFPIDFYVGDLAYLYGKHGQVQTQLTASMETITLKQKNQTGTVITGIDFMPFVGTDGLAGGENT